MAQNVEDELDLVALHVLPAAGALAVELRGETHRQILDQTLPIPSAMSAKSPASAITGLRQAFTPGVPAAESGRRPPG